MYYNQKEIGTRIAKLRKENGLTQEQMAEELNISASYLGKIERGIQAPSLPLLIELAVFLKSTTDYLLMGYDLRQENPKELLDSVITQLGLLKQKL